MQTLSVSDTLTILARAWLPIWLDAALKGTAALAVAGLVCLLLRSASAALRHLAWCVAVGSTLLMPLLSHLLPAWPLPVLPRALATVWRAPASPRAAPSSPPVAADASLGASRSTQRQGLSGRPEPTAPPSTVSPSHPAAPRAPAFRSNPPVQSASADAPAAGPVWALLAWLAGAALVAAPLLAGTLGLQRITRGLPPITDGPWAELLASLTTELGLRRRVALKQSDRVSVPMTWGLLRPAVLLPAAAEQWPTERRRLVLRHELAHVQRADCLTQLLAQLACVLYWFHPLVWVAARQLRIERERACDDRVLAGEAKASDYAQHLLEIARAARHATRESLAAVAMARPSQLENRLLAVLDADRARESASRGAALATVAAGLAIVLSLAVVAPIPRAGPPERPAGREASLAAITLRKLPDMPLRYQYFAEQVSPDGTKLALVRIPPKEGLNIAVYEFASRRTTSLTRFTNRDQREQPDSPVWSPDGRRVVFTQFPLKDRGPNSEVRVATLDGSTRLLYRTADHGGVLRPTDWLRDGSAIVAVLQQPDGQNRLGLLPATGGAFRTVCSLGGKTGGRPRASPDGRFFVFATGRDGARDLQVASRDGRSLHRLTDHPADDTQPLWSPDGRHVVFLSRRLGRWALWGIAVVEGRPAGEPFLIKDGMDQATLLNWLPRGQLVYNNFYRVLDLYTVVVDPATGAAVSRPRRLPYSRTGGNVGPAWSPDGRSLAFFSQVPGDERPMVVVLPAGGGPAREIPIPVDQYHDPDQLDPLIWHLSWLPDGSGLSFASLTPDRRPVLLRISLATGEWARAAMPARVPQRYPHPSIEWTRDGRAYYTNVATGRDAPERIVEYEGTTGRTRVVWTPPPPITHLRHLSLSPDGRALAFMAVAHQPGSVQNRLWILDLETRRTRVVSPARTAWGALYLREAPAAWSPDGRLLMVEVNSGRQGHGRPYEYHLCSVTGGPPRKLDVGELEPRGAPAWSPDGKQVAFATMTFRADNWVIENVVPSAENRRTATRKAAGAGR